MQIAFIRLGGKKNAHSSNYIIVSESRKVLRSYCMFGSNKLLRSESPSNYALLLFNNQESLESTVSTYEQKGAEGTEIQLPGIPTTIFCASFIRVWNRYSSWTRIPK